MPIIIEHNQTKISSQEELFQLYQNDRETYNSLVVNGDAQRMSFAYSRELPCTNSTEEFKITQNYIEKDKDPFMSQGEAYLFGLEYIVAHTPITQDIKLIGMHRHKSVLKGNFENEIAIFSNLSIKYSLLQDVTFVVKAGAKLRLSASMLDKVFVRVENGGMIELQDVEFSNMDKECVRLEKGGVVGLYRDVRFFDVHRKFNIEYAALQECGLMIDFHNPMDILHFLETSDVKHIELLDHFKVPGNIELKQPVVFINKSDEQIKIQAVNIAVTNDLLFSGNFSVDANVHLHEVNNVVIGLSSFIGTMEIRDSEAIKINSTHFHEANRSITITGSQVEFVNSNIQKSVKPIALSSSAISFASTSFNEVSELCSFVKVEASEDDILLERERANSLKMIKNCQVVSSSIAKTTLLDELMLSNVVFHNNNYCFDLTSCRSVSMNKIISKRMNTFAILNNSFGHINNSQLSEGSTAIRMINSNIELTESNIENCETGVHLEAGIIKVMHSSINRNKYGVLMEGLNCGVEHYESSFNNNTQRGILQKPGSTVVDLKELEDFEKCQVS